MHRLNGEAVGLRAERETMAGVIASQVAELERLYRVEGELRGVVADQDAHLGRCYAEIERLNRLIEEMRATRAWRAHEWWQRKGQQAG